MPQIIPASQIRTFIENQGILPFHGFMIDDGLYALPNEGWLLDDFAPALAVFYQQFGIDRWKANSNDCGKFTKVACAFASILHARTPDAPDAGLAFGEFWHIADRSGSGHAVNFAVVPSSARSVAGASPWKLLFFEPQTREEISLSPKEIESCFGLKI